MPAGREEDDYEDGAGIRTSSKRTEPHPPRTSKQVFNKKNVGILRRDNPNWSDAELLKGLKDAWAAMTPEQAAKYEGMAKDDQLRFERETAAFTKRQNSGYLARSPKAKRYRKGDSVLIVDEDDNEVQPALSAYIHFCNARRASVTAKLKAELKDAFQPKLVMSKLGKMWSTLPENEKATFRRMEREDKKRATGSDSDSDFEQDSDERDDRGDDDDYMDRPTDSEDSEEENEEEFAEGLQERQVDHGNDGAVSEED